MIIIVPSRGRPHKMAELITAWEQTRHMAQLFIVVDDDDPKREEYREALYDAPDWVSWRRFNGTGMVNALNDTAVTVARTRLHIRDIGFMGDDHRPRTRGWDVKFHSALTLRPGIVWGNDTIQGPNLPTHVVMSAAMIRVMGHMAPRELTHLYVDNYWKMLGESVGSTYLDDVVIEHMHPIAKKSEWDEHYERVNAGEMYAHDADVFNTYVATGQLDADIKISMGANGD